MLDPNILKVLAGVQQANPHTGAMWPAIPRLRGVMPQTGPQLAGDVVPVRPNTLNPPHWDPTDVRAYVNQQANQQRQAAPPSELTNIIQMLQGGR